MPFNKVLFLLSPKLWLFVINFIYIAVDFIVKWVGLEYARYTFRDPELLFANARSSASQGNATSPLRHIVILNTSMVCLPKLGVD